MFIFIMLIESYTKIELTTMGKGGRGGGGGGRGGKSAAKSGRGGKGSPHANRSNSMNKNNPSYAASVRNRSMQLDPQNPRYQGGSKKNAGTSAYRGGLAYDDDDDLTTLCVICGRDATSTRSGVPFCDNHAKDEISMYFHKKAIEELNERNRELFYRSG